ncbi:MULTISPECIES: LexA family transcriptional regulator [unclassified Snodgrassella]|uniref:helix-turn-helix domain-containing protein n=1 Tax=unclassified Snodgrassella TaxID=2625236 RepID=UPI0018DB841A|nr:MULTISPECIES: LexA family transcriptional regulator [unclassified Snodgrassella]MBI0067593.1 LexA family transcriptional regulator [Snodgrassella sp. M0110]MBI0076443.1 LexA family transcriptional regulator [Snodgrassella sp. M0118]MBI0078893.1 LexA family transcriptional regulator [Snodgrassella sp. M0112]
MKFAKQLKNARLAAGLSQKELAQKTSITPSLISRYELGKVVPRLDTVNKIMNILNFQHTENLPRNHYNNGVFLSIPPLPIQHTNIETTHISILKEDLNNHNFQIENLFYATMSGSSMQNLLNDGDKFIIDISQKQPVDGKIYAFNQGNLFRIKILQNLPNQQIRLKSYNNYEYPEEIVALSEIELIGQIIYRAGYITL